MTKRTVYYMLENVSDDVRKAVKLSNIYFVDHVIDHVEKRQATVTANRPLQTNGIEIRFKPVVGVIGQPDRSYFFRLV